MSWLFKQVWVWILIAFLLGLILTWIYVVHKASRTVEPAEDGPTKDDSETTEDGSHHGAAVAGGAAAAGAGVVAASVAAEHHEAEGTDAEADEHPDSPEAAAVDEVPAKAAAHEGQDAHAGAKSSNESTTVASAKAASRDDQPEAAGAAAAAKARARAEEQQATAPAEPADDSAAPAEPAAPDRTGEDSTDGEANVPAAGATAAGVAAAAGAGVAAVHHHSAAQADDVEQPDEAGEHIGEAAAPADEASRVDQAKTSPPSTEQVGDTTTGAAGASGIDEDPMTKEFGPGAASSGPDGSAPEGYPVKGNADSMLFHTKDSPRYAATRPHVWFKDEASATTAGFAHWDRTKRGHADEPAVDESPAPAEAPAVDESPAPTEAPPAEEAPTGETDPITEQFGHGAASPRADGSAPSPDYTIKGDADTMMFHTQDSPNFQATEAEIWFKDEESAKAVGFLHWDRSKR